MNTEIANQFHITDPEPLETYELFDYADIDALSEHLSHAHMPD